MQNNNTSFELMLSLQNLTKNNDSEFAEAANRFVEELQTIDELSVSVPQQGEPGTRGLLAVLSAITVWGAKTGAFKALSSLISDFFARYRNAEVVLKFRDGSSLKLKGLSEKEAEQKIEEHLQKASAKI